VTRYYGHDVVIISTGRVKQRFHMRCALRCVALKR